MLQVQKDLLTCLDISNPVRPFSNCKTWSDLVLKEFLAQGELEKAAGLPISPNMDAAANQSHTQLSFTRLIVQPLFESLLELFPRTLSLIDLIVDNTRQWGGVDAPKSKRNEERVTSKKPSLPISFSEKKTVDVFSRRMSLAAGTIEIPDSLQKFFAKGSKPTRNSLRRELQSISETI